MKNHFLISLSFIFFLACNENTLNRGEMEEKHHSLQLSSSSSVDRSSTLIQDSGGAGNGGSDNEVLKLIITNTLRRDVLNLYQFFLKEASARKEFPEIDFESFYSVCEILLQSLDSKSDKGIRLVADGESYNNSKDKNNLIDKYSVERTALNFPEKTLILIDVEKFHKLLERPIVRLVLVFHEILGLLKVEFNDVKFEDLSLSYESSKKLINYILKINKLDYELNLDIKKDKFKSILRIFNNFFNKTIEGDRQGYLVYTGKCYNTKNISRNAIFLIKKKSKKINRFEMKLNDSEKEEKDLNSLTRDQLIIDYIHGFQGNSVVLNNLLAYEDLNGAFIGDVDMSLIDKSKTNGFYIDKRFIFRLMENDRLVLAFSEARGAQFSCWGVLK